MRYMDKVKVINDKKEYAAEKVFKGMTGTIIETGISEESFMVIFADPQMINDDIFMPIKIEDLENVEERNATKEYILKNMNPYSPDRWCIVEDGYIQDLDGNKKNKIPYIYNS